MRPIVGFAICGLATLATGIFLPAASTSTKASDADLIIASERAWAQAPVKGDAVGMARFMSDDYVQIASESLPGTNKNGWVTLRKSEWVDLVRSGREKYTSVELRNIKVYLHGDVATTTGEYSQTGTEDGKDISASGFYIDTWVKKNGDWRVVSSVFP